MIRAIEHVDLKHEINNASASIGANLAYISLQSTNELKQTVDEERTKEVFTEFVEVCDESREALKRVAASLGQPTTDEGEFPTEVDLTDCLVRTCKCLNNYMPTQKIESTLQPARVNIIYQDFIFSLIRLLMAFVDALSKKNQYRSTSIHLVIQESETKNPRLILSAALAAEDASVVLTKLEDVRNEVHDPKFRVSASDGDGDLRVIFDFE